MKYNVFHDGFVIFPFGYCMGQPRSSAYDRFFRMQTSKTTNHSARSTLTAVPPPPPPHPREGNGEDFVDVPSLRFLRGGRGGYGYTQALPERYNGDSVEY